MTATTGLGTITLVDYVYDDKEQEYKQTMAMTMKQAVPQSWLNVFISNSTIDKQKAVCLNSLPTTDPCSFNAEGDYSNTFKLFSRTCFKYLREGLYKVAADEKWTGGSGCSFDGTTRVFAVTKIDSQKDQINWTIVEDREVQRCGEPVRRYTRTESIIYQVQRGCILHAKAQGCVPGVETCKPCASDTVPMSVSGMTVCGSKLSKCNTTRKGFRGCPMGFEVAPGKAEEGLLLCQPCPPNYQQPDYPDDSGSGYRAKCQFCAEWQESSNWGTQSCWGCPEGHYPRNKKAPLKCTPCPPGSYSPYRDQKQCTKCSGGFYTDKPGQKSCKKCPTEWRCLVPNKILGRFAATPYRWDESGNPACPSLDGKTCWKTDPDACSAKLKKMKELIDAGKIKSVVCGAMHKQLWGGFDGYSDSTHWCSITRMLFMQPGKKDVGATSCSAKDASMVASSSESIQTEAASRCDCCDQCSA